MQGYDIEFKFFFLILINHFIESKLIRNLIIEKCFEPFEIYSIWAELNLT